jgi:ketosteroid isomerase-like protein
MSAENVETVRTAYEAFMRGDLGGVAEHFAEDVEWESPDSVPIGGLVSGRDAVIENFAQIPSLWSSFSVEPQEYIDAGEHVVVTGVQRATGPGGSFEARYLHLFKLRGGKVVRGEFIGDSAKARDSLGG